jgi:hypothetical protein
VLWRGIFLRDVAGLYERGRALAAATYVLAFVVLPVGGLFAGLHACVGSRRCIGSAWIRPVSS